VGYGVPPRIQDLGDVGHGEPRARVVLEDAGQLGTAPVVAGPPTAHTRRKAASNGTIVPFNVPFGEREYEPGQGTAANVGELEHSKSGLMLEGAMGALDHGGWTDGHDSVLTDNGARSGAGLGERPYLGSSDARPEEDNGRFKADGEDEVTEAQRDRWRPEESQPGSRSLEVREVLGLQGDNRRGEERGGRFEVRGVGSRRPDRVSTEMGGYRRIVPIEEEGERKGVPVGTEAGRGQQKRDVDVQPPTPLSYEGDEESDYRYQDSDEESQKSWEGRQQTYDS
jgi:hypothetical protein